MTARRVAIDTRPLRHADFRRQWLGGGISTMGVQLTAVAVSVQVYSITGSSFWVGMLGLAGLVPLVAFGLWGGAVADAFDRRLVLLVASLLSWACTLALLAQALLGVRSVGLLLGLVAVQAGAFAMASPTRGSLVPRLLPVELVPAGNTLIHTAGSLATVLGPLLAGLVLRRDAFALAYALDALLFTAALYSAVRLPSIPPLGKTQPPGLRSVIDGLRFIAGHPVLLLSFAVDIVAMVFAMPRALFPEAAESRFGEVGSAVGWLFAAIAIGSVVAGLLSGWIGRIRRQGATLIGAVVVWGLAVALSGVAGQLWLVVALLALAGAADLVSSVFRQTILQTYAPDEMRGRMQGVFVVVVVGGPRFGDLRAGATAAAFGATASWVGGGIACAVVVIAVAVIWPALLRYPSVSESPREPPSDR